MGTWYAFITGLGFQFICEITILIFFIDWKECAIKAHEEMIRENGSEIERLSARGGSQ